MDRLTVKEAAPYIGCSEFKLRDMVRLKQVPCYRIGSRILFRKVVLDQWIAQQERENAQGVR
ncbi:MAG: helix-turn-helix domain-containing protein [Gorillibacterium sp.]|nr:helix-turn-helix domain-containing protein [Gorillibacterium sp.]